MQFWGWMLTQLCLAESRSMRGFVMQKRSRKLWGRETVCAYSQGCQLTCRRKGSLPLSASRLVLCGRRAAWRKFKFAKTALGDFPVLLTLLVLLACIRVCNFHFKHGTGL